jgi:hypothetical protein
MVCREFDAEIDTIASFSYVNTYQPYPVYGFKSSDTM